jgi:hypothetical protein
VWRAAGVVALGDVAAVALLAAAPRLGISAASGWVAVLGAVWAFGGYGVLIKAPALVEAKCDAFIFQVPINNLLAAEHASSHQTGA